MPKVGVQRWTYVIISYQLHQGTALWAPRSVHVLTEVKWFAADGDARSRPWHCHTTLSIAPAGVCVLVNAHFHAKYLASPETRGVP